MMIRTLATTLLLALLGALAARAQGVAASESFTIGPRDSAIFLSHEFIVPGTIRLTVDSVTTIGAAGELTLDTRYGVIHLGPVLRALVADTAVRHAVTVAYNYRPIRLEREYA